MLKTLLVFGTRPEAIKMAPVVKACMAHPDIDPIVCLTGQHKEMLAQVTEYFSIQADRDLELMKPNQTLAGLTAGCVEGIDGIIVECQPHCVVAQGDTTTVMASSLAAFYRHVPMVHVEAGLRTGNLLSPWPEEMNRRITGLIAGLHCAPTQRSADNLLAEGVPPGDVHVTGNTVIDALLWTAERERSQAAPWHSKYAYLNDQKMVLVTGHRRENFGGGFESICKAIATLAESFADHFFLYPVHLNPNVQEPVNRLLGGLPNVRLIPPAAYPEFVWLMDRSTLIISDSGGVQEEAPSLKKPVLVMRDTTERPEAMEAGACELVGTSVEKIVRRATDLLTNEEEYQSHQIDKNPYGDGHASQKIVELMLARGWEQ